MDIGKGELFIQHNGEMVKIGTMSEAQIDVGKSLALLGNSFIEAAAKMKAILKPLAITIKFGKVRALKSLRNIADKNHKAKKRYKNIEKARMLLRRA